MVMGPERIRPHLRPFPSGIEFAGRVVDLERLLMPSFPDKGWLPSLAFKTELDSGHRAWLGESVDGAEVEARAAAALLASVSGDPAGVSSMLDASQQAAAWALDGVLMGGGSSRLVDGVASGLTIRSRTRASRVESRSGRLYVGTTAGRMEAAAVVAAAGVEGLEGSGHGGSTVERLETCGWFGTAEPPSTSGRLHVALDDELGAIRGQVVSNVDPSRAPRGRALVGVALTGAADEAALRAAGRALWGPGGSWELVATSQASTWLRDPGSPQWISPMPGVWRLAPVLEPASAISQGQALALVVANHLGLPRLRRAASILTEGIAREKAWGRT
jgi:hypothetical protein